MLITIFNNTHSTGNFVYTDNSSDFINFYFIDKTNKSQIFLDNENYYHNISLYVNISSGARLAIDIYSESCDVNYALFTDLQGEKDYFFNFITYTVTISLSRGYDYQPDFINGSYFLIDHGRINNYLGEARYDPGSCKSFPNISTPLIPVFLAFGMLFLVAVCYRHFNRT